MKKQSYIFALISALLLSGNIIAYEYDFSNWTPNTLVIMLEREGIEGKYFEIIKPGEMIKHVWNDANCLRNTMKWAKWRGTEAEYQQWATDRGRIPAEKQNKFENKYLSDATTSLGWIRLDIKMIPSASFDEIKKNASDLVEGVPLIGRGLEKLVAGSAAIAGSSLCKNRTFGIIDTGKKDLLTRQPVLVAETGEGE